MNLSSIQRAARSYNPELRQKAIQVRPELEQKFAISQLSEDIYIYWFKERADARMVINISLGLMALIAFGLINNYLTEYYRWASAIIGASVFGLAWAVLLDKQDTRSRELASQLVEAMQEDAGGSNSAASPVLPFDVPPQD